MSDTDNTNSQIDTSSRDSTSFSSSASSTDAPDCDLDLTLELFDLFKTPQPERDQNWIEDFLEVVVNASLVTMDPQIQRGPDGFPYLALSLPKPNEDFDAVSVHHALSFCMKQGAGIALFAHPEEAQQPEWIFPFGSLWAYEQFQNFLGDPKDERPDKSAAASVATSVADAAVDAPTGLSNGPSNDTSTGSTEATESELGEQREVEVRPPSEDFLPIYARRALARFLKQSIGLKAPSVAMITDPENEPTRCLMFTDLLPERFEKKEDFVKLMTALRWFLPPTRGLMVAVPQLAQYASPLAPNEPAN